MCGEYELKEINPEKLTKINCIELHNHRGTPGFIKMVFDVVRNIDSSKPVVFFCLAGAHRSTFTCVCYLMYIYKDTDFDQFYAKIKAIRPVIEMLGFRPLLEEFAALIKQ